MLALVIGTICGIALLAFAVRRLSTAPPGDLLGFGAAVLGTASIGLPLFQWTLSAASITTPLEVTAAIAIATATMSTALFALDILLSARTDTPSPSR